MGEKEICYYFAYGSNLNPNRMHARKAWFSERTLGKLLDYELIFNKKRLNGTAAANIQCKQGSIVYGALYCCTAETLNALDHFEGVSKGHYARKNVDVFTNSGGKVTATTYIAGTESCDDSLKKISKEYLEHLLCGHDILPAEYYSMIQSFSAFTVDIK